MKNHRNSSMNNIKDLFEDLKEWIAEHKKIVMPAILLVCVLITVLIAFNSNKKAAAEVESANAETAATLLEPAATEEVKPLPLEENAYPAVNTLISDYYAALAEGSLEKITEMNAFVDDTEKLRIQEISKYIEAYPELTIYTKAGPAEGSYLVYVYSKVKFTEYDKLVPGMQAFYVCTDETGKCYINEGEDNTVVTEYIREISLQDDVVDLNNKVAVEYNELLESDEELNAFLADLGKRIDLAVGVALAQAETDASAADGATANAAADDAAAAEVPAETPAASAEGESAVKTVRVIDVVNIRTSDSETADKLGKAQIGDEFTLLEEKGNGWSKISFEGQDAYIKSEYLETVTASETPAAETPAAETDNTEEQEAPPAQEEPAEEPTAPAASGDGTTVTVKENVNVRKSASETGEKLGLVYIGEKLELIMKQADGWTKVKYNGKTGYVKSDYVE